MLHIGHRTMRSYCPVTSAANFGCLVCWRIDPDRQFFGVYHYSNQTVSQSGHRYSEAINSIMFMLQHIFARTKLLLLMLLFNNQYDHHHHQGIDCRTKLQPNGQLVAARFLLEEWWWLFCVGGGLCEIF